MSGQVVCGRLVSSHDGSCQADFRLLGSDQIASGQVVCGQLVSGLIRSS